jgi:acetyl esterase/lipase
MVMKIHYIAILVFTLGSFGSIGMAQTEIPVSGASSVEVYKSIDGVELKAWIFNPPEHNTEGKVPVIVFFFGGGWRAGNPIQFTKHCEYLAARGMVAITVDYRVYNRHGVKAHICVADAKSAIRWIRQNAERLGVDPDRIVASGGSSGGHLAASTATLPGFNDPADDISISAAPNALALFNPAVVLAEAPGLSLSTETIRDLNDRMGVPLASISPYHHLVKGVVPTIIFHGIDDNVVPFKSVKIYDEAMDELGNQSTLVAYEGEGHGFFNYLKKNNGPYIDTVKKLDDFLVQLGYLQAPSKSITQ